jgi:hypothetical protein
MVHVIWVLDQNGVVANELPRLVAKRLEISLTGPELTRYICKEGCVTWKNGRQVAYSKPLFRYFHVTILISGSILNRNREALQPNRNHLKSVTGLLVTHTHSEIHFHKWGLANNLTCSRCQD